MFFLLDISIIGGGLTGTAMLWQCIQQAQTAADENPRFLSRIRIRVFEKREEFGPGFPHNQDNVLPCHITNMYASDMGIFPENPGDFQSWITKNQRHLSDRFDWFGRFMDQQDYSACFHYPRAIMGEYLKTRFLQAVQLARRLGISLELHSFTEVEGIQSEEGGFRLFCRNLNSGKLVSMKAAEVLIATGHWQKESLDAFFFSYPWPAQKLQREIPKGEKVAVIGTSLSAIETLLTLTSEGNFVRSESGELDYLPPEQTRTFCLYSRKGMLPKVRGRSGSYRNHFFHPKILARMWADKTRNLSLEALFDILDAELQNAYGRPFGWNEIENPSGTPEKVLSQSIKDAIEGDNHQGDVLWQTILNQGLSVVKEMYLNLTLRQRKIFDDQYTSVFFTHAATQPVINAEKLLALIRAGIVEIKSLGTSYQFLKDKAGSRYVFLYKDQYGHDKKEAYSYVVNARGQDKSVLTDKSLLTHSMVASGMVLTEESRPVPNVKESWGSSDTGCYKTGSIWINPDTHQVMQRDPDGQIMQSESLYAVGAMTRGQIINASMAQSIVRSVSKVARHLIKKAIPSSERSG
jgi:uncharacterized NAD(P)/FAD-binding protein YdhS